ncbi:hypothetical protein F4780DRAFT_783143 [Xylariomycetidae sp. FL0641]|nr:hypothetical protein F4780DRAFT_783143 [Xylariomycetidae sp. FL0641]
MTCTVLAQLKRRRDLTPAAFRAYYETHHLPLLQELLGGAAAAAADAIPLSHTRHYVDPAQSASTALDAVAVMVFEDRAAYERMRRRLAEPAVRERVAADREAFADGGVVVEVPVDSETSTRPPPLARDGGKGAQGLLSPVDLFLGSG